MEGNIFKTVKIAKKLHLPKTYPTYPKLIKSGKLTKYIQFYDYLYLFTQNSPEPLDGCEAASKPLDKNIYPKYTMDSAKYIYQDACYYVVRNVNYEPKVKKFNTTKYSSPEDALEAARSWRDEQEKQIAERNASQLTIFKETKAAKEKAEQKLWEAEKDKREQMEREENERNAKQYFAELASRKKELTPLHKWQIANPERSQTKAATEGIADYLIANSMLPYDKRTITEEIIEKQVQTYEQIFSTRGDRLFMGKDQLMHLLFPKSSIIVRN